MTPVDPSRLLSTVASQQLPVGPSRIRGGDGIRREVRILTPALAPKESTSR